MFKIENPFLQIASKKHPLGVLRNEATRHFHHAVYENQNCRRLGTRRQDRWLAYGA